MSSAADTGLPPEGMRLYEIERRLYGLIAADPSIEQGWPDTLWPVMPDEVLAAARTAMGLFAHTNGFIKPPSLAVVEAELVGMIRDVLEVPPAGATTITIGGTESNFLAVKGALFRERDRRGGQPEAPNMVIPATAHPSFDKAAEEFGIEVRRVGFDELFRVRIDAVADALDGETILIVGSTPSYTHGTLDPIPELSTLALERDVWLHIDACVGGFLLPHLKRLGLIDIEPGFANPGVTSIAADLHKFGLTPTGISTLSVRDAELARHHGFKLEIARGWPFRDYARAGFSGSRSGGVLAGAWATLMALGRAGYERVAEEICAAGALLGEGIEAIPGLELVAPHECGVLVFTSSDPEVPIARVAAGLEGAGWFPTLALEPTRLQILLSPLPPATFGAFLTRLAGVVDDVRAGRILDEAETTTYGGADQAAPQP